jgi:hypothetical protein
MVRVLRVPSLRIEWNYCADPVAMRKKCSLGAQRQPITKYYFGITSTFWTRARRAYAAS